MLIGCLISLIIWVIVALIICYVAELIINMFVALPPQIMMLIRLLIGLIVLLQFLGCLGILGGSVIGPAYWHMHY